MKYECDLIRDLLPLYLDEVCSDSSRDAVESHLSGCAACRDELSRYRDGRIDSTLAKERDDVVGHHAQAVRRRSLTVGLCFASVLAVPTIVCLIVNLVTGHALDWFFIVLAALMMFGSVTAVPLISEKDRFLRALGCFTGSLLFLLAAVCVYTGANWFLGAAIPVLLGLSIAFFPYVAKRLPLKGFVARHRGLLAMAVDTALLYAVVVTARLYGKFVDFGEALLLTTVPLVLPWALFAIIRYSKACVRIKAGLCVMISGAFLSMIENIVSLIDTGAPHVSFGGANLLVWEQDMINPNVYLLVLVCSLAIGGALVASGALRKNAGG